MWNGLKKLSKKYDGFLKKLLQKFVASQGENIKKCCKYYYAAQYVWRPLVFIIKDVYYRSTLSYDYLFIIITLLSRVGIINKTTEKLTTCTLNVISNWKSGCMLYTTKCGINW